MAENDLSAYAPETRVRSLADKSIVEVNPAVKAIRYVRTAKELVRTADSYYEDHMLESAYLLYMRYLTLSLEKLKDHPGYKEVPDDDKKEMRTNCKRILPMAEKVKAELLVQYQAEYKEELRKREKLEETHRAAERKLKMDQARTAAVPTAPTLAGSQFGPAYSNVPSYATSVATGAALKGVSYEFIDSVSNGTSRSSPTPTPQLHPQFDRRSKPSRFQSPMGTESLRTIVIPGDLISRFTLLASGNTAKNIETCGVLCGKVIRDQLVITHLVLPKQTGTPDSCTTLNEEEIYNIIDRYSLIQLGWIHTHPSQTSFLSSVDLHTHLSYQLMLGESVAIVVAPSKQECNVFTLSAVGMEALQKCGDSGFHPHNQLDEPYFVDASHSTFDPSRCIIVEDLRR